ncbi:protein of unknown function DUF224 cysteine-rich region domain protein [Desulfofarcimen acetoxidans DSM 771]|uniref:4Fe-4S ferredoxin-type domain-containing protein n=1 Tax=Desulfofarcimen acetoxidans (strain ATCC 49208 / DSM 771 / KCTC 5769 / VKM B-1644 / 5575) TaxID=485916 RepID=C8W6Q3_DESAS|nr:pyridine nucleotide-disulfide oxidoreductase/dicluster-binding protein [Desulfofarcimen acetoxidans]ACV64162.1 protein of unknown function DUF224 cysteine-rich region domain protein [Desulfofarcimen acetoxidans DSM 771]
MEQKELRELESKCIQEQPPACTAACPIHVDARAFVNQVSKGKWGEARKTLNKTMPFPAILGRICDHPCQAACRRGEVGDAINIGALERVCIEKTNLRAKIPLIPKNSRRVAVVGSGLGALTAASDLARKGYSVTVFDSGDRLGGRLWDYPEEVLPEQVIADEISLLGDLGVESRLKTDISQEGFLSGLIAEFSAVFVQLEDGKLNAASEWGLPTDERGNLKIDPATMFAGMDGVFAGGLSRAEGKYSPVFDVLEGRRAAVSVDRFIQGTSQTIGRDREGPYSSLLYTDLKGISPLPAVPFSSPERGYDEEAAISEAERCIQCQCLECVKACAYLEKYGSYPKRYVREVYNNESIVKGIHVANKMINSCSLCGLCETVCPGGLSMAEVCMAARENMVKNNKMPPSAHDFALMDMHFSNSDKFAMAHHEPGSEKSSYLFFPGCQLSASSPGQVEQVYGYLRHNLTGGVGLMLRCCGAPAAWAAREDLFQAGLAEIRAQWESMGKPQIIPACSTCYSELKRHLPEAELISLWEVLEASGLPASEAAATGMVSPEKNAEVSQCAGAAANKPLALHDPCTTRHEQQIQETVRGILAQLGCQTEELNYSRERTTCCGFGGLLSNVDPELARQVTRKRSAESPADYVTYCAMCRDNLAASGKRTMHVLDLLFPLERETDPAARPRPGYSERRENRARLKNKLLCELWGEQPKEKENYEKVRLFISPEVQERLEDRRILKSDLQMVIEHAEKTGNKLQNRKTGRLLAYYKPVQVTYWVDYLPEKDGYEIYNAYCHRMEIVEDVK